MKVRLKKVGQNKENRVSVIIPTYNRAKTLPIVIRSVLQQTTPVFEILICDDGSTDTSREVVKRISDKKIKWIAGTHTGLPAVPRNKGLRLAKGDWIAMLDSDDQWLPEKLASQLDLATRSGYKTVCTNGYWVANHRKQETMINFPRNAIAFRDLLQVNHIICSSVLFHRSLLQKVQGFPENNYLKSIEDFALWLRIASIVPFGYVNTPLVLYRSQPEDSVRRQTFYKNFGQQLIAAMFNFLPWYLRHRTGI